MKLQLERALDCNNQEDVKTLNILKLIDPSLQYNTLDGCIIEFSLDKNVFEMVLNVLAERERMRDEAKT